MITKKKIKRTRTQKNQNFRKEPNFWERTVIIDVSIESDNFALAEVVGIYEYIWMYIRIYEYIWIYMNIMNTHQILYEFPTTHHRKADGPLSWPWKSFVLFRRRCWRCAQPSLRPGCWGNRNSGKSRKASAKRVNQGQPVIDVNVNDMLPISPHHCFWYNGRPTCKGHAEGDRMRRGTQAWQWWAEILSLKAGPAGLIFDQS